jgi:hypothetical protein
MNEPGYRLTRGIMQTGGINLSWVWLAMMLGFFLGALCFVMYAYTVIVKNRMNRIGETLMVEIILQLNGCRRNLRAPEQLHTE